MKNLVSIAINSLIGLTAGNYFWQLIQDPPQWEIAFERSFFQAVAILTVVLFSRMVRPVNGPKNQ